MHSKEYMVTEFLIMSCLNICGYKFNNYFYANILLRGGCFVSRMYRCVNSLFIFIKRLLHERKYWEHGCRHFL